MERHPASNMRILSAAIAPLARKTSIVIANAAAVVPGAAPRRRGVSITITIALQLLLWCSILTAAVAVYIFMQQLADTTVMPTCVLMCLAPLVSIIYILLHCAVSRRFARSHDLGEEDIYHASISQSTVRVSVAVTILWLVTAGWNMVMVVRQVSCPVDPTREMIWKSQLTCIAHRIGACITVVAFLDSVCLFAILAQAHQPFEAHLFGVIDCEGQTSLAPSPSKYSMQRRAQSASSTMLCSDPSCRGPTRSLSQGLLMYRSALNMNIHPQPPPPPHTAGGLGIYAPLPRSPSPPKRATKLNEASLPPPPVPPHTSGFSVRSGSPVRSDDLSLYSYCSALPPPQFPSSLHVPLHLGTVRLSRRTSSDSSGKE